MKKWTLLALLGAFLIVIAGCGQKNIEQNAPSQETPKKAAVTYTHMVVPKGIPVLMYHMIGDIKDNDAVIHPDLFAEQMKYLHDNGYHTLTMDQFYDYIRNGKPVPEKPVLLTFDDGYPDTYTIVFPTLKKYNMTATVFVNPGDIGQRMTWEQLKEMRDAGFTISNHGFLHKRMAEMTSEEQYNNIKNAQESIKRNLGLDNMWFCYPYGSYNEDSTIAAKKIGIKMAFKMSGGWAHKGDPLYEIPRIWIGNRVDIKHFEERITTETYSDL